MKKIKAISAILLMCLIVAGIFLVKKSIKVSEIQVMMDVFDNVNVKVISDPKSLNSPIRVIEYSILEKSCLIKWMFSEIIYNGNKHVSLRLNYSWKPKCILSFKKQKKYHEMVLKRALKDWDISKIKTITTSSLNTLNPDFSWNKKIIRAALTSKKLADYKQKFPNHNPRYPINRIFVELANQAKVYSDFSELFKSLGINIILKSCEKVFTSSKSTLEKKYGYKLKKYKTIIHDAGILYFSTVRK